MADDADKHYDELPDTSRSTVGAFNDTIDCVVIKLIVVKENNPSDTLTVQVDSGEIDAKMTVKDLK